MRIPAVSKMSLTASLRARGRISISVMKMCSRRPAGERQAQCAFFSLERAIWRSITVADQLPDLGVADDLDVAVVVGLAPVREVPLLGELVEDRARHRDLEPRVVGLALGHVRAGQPDPEDLDVAAAPQLEPHDQLQWASAGTSRSRFRTATAISSAGGPPQILFRSRSFFPITIFWISEVPSPITSSGASR